MFSKKREIINGREAIAVGGIGDISLADTMECGQCFRYLKLAENNGYVEYMTVVGDKLIFVGQRARGELIFYGLTEEDIDLVCAPYFSFGVDFQAVKNDVIARTSSAFLQNAAACASGISILAQDPWEALFSFIISQNNNIPRIRGIIRKICAEYGENLALRDGIGACPLDLSEGRGECACDARRCRDCGICYTFPRPDDILERPEGLLPSHPGFRYRYLCDAADKVYRREVDLDEIKSRSSYEYTLEQLSRIVGVGAKVASCVALFGFSNFEAFPVDVWMKRAIDTYFGGSLDPKELGAYAGVAQQYIFHYIRQISKEE